MSQRAEIGILGSLLAVTWALACASTTGKGSETHFTACAEDEDCPSAEPYCVERRCSETRESGAGGAPGAGGNPAAGGSDAAGGSPGAGGTTSECGALPPALYQCTQFCGSDRVMDLECRDGVWKCPEETPQRVDLCPEDTCWFPGASCCSNDGSTVAGSCPGGGEMVCPPASVPRPSQGGECPSTCASIPEAPAGPHLVTFQLTNAGGADVAVWQGCVLTHAITACADGYEAPLPTWPGCTSPCGSSAGCIQCGACRDEVDPVGAGESLAIDWAGTAFTTRVGAECACHDAHDLPAGSYRITVPVFPREPVARPGGGTFRTSLYEVAVDFTLPAPGGVVEIPLDSSSHLAPCPGPGLCVIRLDPDSLQSGCTLEPSAEPDCPAEAPRRFRCERPVPLDAACVEGARETGAVAGPEGVIRCCP